MMRTLAFFVALLAANQSFGDPMSRYYVTGWGIEDQGNTPGHSHTLVLFTEVRADGTMNFVRINWLPEDRHMRRGEDMTMPRRGKFPGQNPRVEDTLARAHNANRNVIQHGPFEIRKELYDLAERQERSLEAGEKKYAGIIKLFPRRTAVQCIEAADFFKTANTGVLRGSSGTLAILDSYRKAGMMIDAPPPRDRTPHSHESGMLLPRRAGPSETMPAPRQQVVSPRQPLFPRLRGGR